MAALKVKGDWYCVYLGLNLGKIKWDAYFWITFEVRWNQQIKLQASLSLINNLEPILKGMLKSRYTIVVMFVKFELKIEELLPPLGQK